MSVQVDFIERKAGLHEPVAPAADRQVSEAEGLSAGMSGVKAGRDPGLPTATDIVLPRPA